MHSNYSAQQSELHILPSSTDSDQAARQRRTYYAYDEDDQALAAIRAHYGCSTDSDAVRLALRLLAGAAIKLSMVAPAARRIVADLKAAHHSTG